MKVKINQLNEEENERNADLTIQQLKEKNDQLNRLISKYRESRTRRISVTSQTEQVSSIYVYMLSELHIVYPCIYLIFTYML